MPTLFVVLASTRPGRAGEPVARWFVERAITGGDFDAVELVDLREVDLPALDERNHPKLGAYEHAHTKAWSERVQRADAFAFVTPEYNHGPAPALLNALAYLHAEWAYKPGGLVSYGGVAAGARGAEVTKQVLTTLRMYVPLEAVHIPFVHTFITDGAIVANEEMEMGADALLGELRRAVDVLAPMREGVALPS